MSISTWIDTIRSQRYALLPTTSTPSSPNPNKTSTPTKKRLFQATAISLVLIGITGYSLRSNPNLGIESNVDPYEYEQFTNASETISQLDYDVGEEEPPIPISIEIPIPEEQVEEDVDQPEEGDDLTSDNDGTNYWGLTEEMGWKPPNVGLTDLGEIAESSYRLGIEAGEEGTREYFQLLHDFTLSLPFPLHSPLLTSLFHHSPPNYPGIISAYPSSGMEQPKSMISYKTIHQTDKVFDPNNKLTQNWIKLNKPDGWNINFLDDLQSHEWMLQNFGNSDVNWAWDYMHRGVLKADFLRYLLPLVVGGVYSDVDTQPIRPIEEWGSHSVEYLDLTSTDGSSWRSSLSTHPSVIVGIDVDVHSYSHWERNWPRALGICQWTLSSSPSHPIFLDAVRRVVNSTRVVESWENWRKVEIENLKNQGREKEAEELGTQHRDKAMNVMEWTGPGLFSDSVFAFLLARYNVTWHRLRGLNHPLRIGDVLILPITGFSPGGEKDFGAEGPDSIQANVLHGFRGSWKVDGARR